MDGFVTWWSVVFSDFRFATGNYAGSAGAGGLPGTGFSDVELPKCTDSYIHCVNIREGKNRRFKDRPFEFFEPLKNPRL